MSQPVRSYAGGDYGDRKALREQQQAAPLAEASPVPAGGVFAPTQRPDEPLTAGVDFSPGPGGPGPDPLGEDPDLTLRAALAESRSDALAAILSRVERR